MARPFDITTKHLIEHYPADWARAVGAPADAPVECVDTDLSTISGLADKVLVVREEPAWLLNTELQASADASLPFRLLRDAAILHERHRLAVESAVFLLRRSADHPNLTGRLDFGRPGAGAVFPFRVIRVWEQPAAAFLGALGTLPLAPLCDDAAGRLGEMVGVLRERLSAETVAPGDRQSLWLAVYILMGLRYPEPTIQRLLEGVANMRESSTYQAILREGMERGLERGRAEEARDLLRHFGTRRFGAPPAAVAAALETAGLERLHALLERLEAVESWEELLADPA